MNVKKNQKKKYRAEQEIQGEYNFHAASVGHKMRLIGEMEQEVLQHQAALTRINQEAKAAKAYKEAQAKTKLDKAKEETADFAKAVNEGAQSVSP